MATIEAMITKVERTETGWVRIFTDHDTVKRLDTKDKDRAKQAHDAFLAGEVVLIDYTAKEPRTVGDRTYRDYWFNSATKASSNGASQASLDDIPLAEDSKAKPAGDDQEGWRIAKSVGAKLALETHAQNPFEEQAMVALAWASWIYLTPLPTGIAQFAGGGADPDDDDIPF